MGLSRSGGQVVDLRPALYEAAQRAIAAPSFLNTQPWRWQVHESRLDLFADLDRVVSSVDSRGRLLTISCGAVLHHACVELRAHGLTPDVQRFPDASRTDLLASIAVVDDEHPASQAEVELAHAVQERHSERRPFTTGTRVELSDVELLGRLAAACGASLHRVAEDQKPYLTVAVGNAAVIEGRQEAVRQDLLSWTENRTRGEGLSSASLTNRRSPAGSIRPGAHAARASAQAALGEDTDAELLILATREDTPADWLRAGEALSLVWLTATTHGLAGSVLSNLTEVAGARVLVASLLPEPGHPQLVLRVGFSNWPAAPATARREPETVITVDEREVP